MHAIQNRSASPIPAQRRPTEPARVVHEVNNVLTYAYSLLGGLSEDDAEVRAAAGRGLRRCLDLVGGLVRDFDGTGNPDVATTDVAEIAETAVELGSPSFVCGRARVDIDPGLARVAIPPLRLLQVLLNLVINAGHALEQVGGGVVVVRAAPRGNRVVVSIEDTGPGIAPSLGGSVFDPGVTTGNGRGSGLGLPVCAEILREAGGAIWFEGRPGGGCVFHVSLPVA